MGLSGIGLVGKGLSGIGPFWYGPFWYWAVLVLGLSDPDLKDGMT